MLQVTWVVYTNQSELFQSIPSSHITLTFADDIDYRSKSQRSIIIPFCNKALWLDVASHMASLYQSEWIISELSNYSYLNFVYDSDSRLRPPSGLVACYPSHLGRDLSLDKQDPYAIFGLWSFYHETFEYTLEGDYSSHVSLVFGIAKEITLSVKNL